jgi:hypothetical protein
MAFWDEMIHWVMLFQHADFLIAGLLNVLPTARVMHRQMR